MKKKKIIRIVAFALFMLLWGMGAHAQVPVFYPAQASTEAVYLSWPSFPAAVSYRLYWSTVSGTGTSGTQINISGGGAKSYVHTGLTGGTTYYYTLVGIDASSNPSQPSAELSITPVPQYYQYAGGNGDGHSMSNTCVIKPSGTAATPNSQAITVYTGVEQNYIVWPQEAGATAYNLEYSTTSASGPFTSIYSGTLLTYPHTGLTGGTTYYYRVTASVTGCPMNPSAVVSTTVLPQYYQYAGGSGDGHSTLGTCVIKLSGISAAPNSQPITVYTHVEQNFIYWPQQAGATGYNLEVSTTGAGGPFTSLYNGTNLYYTHDSLIGGTTYYYRVTASLPGGCPLNPSAVVSVTVLPQYYQYAGGNGDGHSTIETCVIKLSGLSAAPNSQAITVYTHVEQNFIFWPQQAGATAYNLEFSTTGAAGPFTSLYNGTSLNYTHDSLSGGTTYYYRVTASLPGGCPLNPSAVVSVTVLPQYYQYAGGNGDGHSTIETCVIKLSGLSAAPNSLPITIYTHVEQNFIYWPQQAGSTGYNLEVSTTGAGGPFTSLYNGTNLNYTHDSLNGGTTYYYRVTASLPGGCPLNPSAVVTVTVLPQYYQYAGGNGDGHSMLATCMIKLSGNSATPNSQPITVYASTEQNYIVWPQEAGATSYTLEFSTTGASGPFASLYSGTNLNYTHSGITGGLNYYYRVVASLSGCPMNPSLVVTGTPVPQYYYYAGGNGDGHSVVTSCTGIPLNIGTIAINPSNYSNMCAGDTVTLTAANGLTWNWSNGATTQTINVTSSGTYTVQVGGVYLCPTISEPITINFSPTSPPVLSISADANPVCGGLTVNYTASAVNGGTAPAYQWQVNGSNQGTNSPGFSYVPADGDSVSCILTSNSNCASSPYDSSYLIMSVATSASPTISITASQNPVCVGGSVTFAASTFNGGSSPVFQWLINGMPAGTNDSTFSYAPVASDMVSCILTSNAICAVPPSDTSNNVQINLSANVMPFVSIFAGPNDTVCSGTVVTFNATPLNGGSTPSYQWTVNGLNVGTNSSSYIDSTLSNNDIVQCAMTSSHNCAITPTVNSNSVTMTVETAAPVSLSIAALQNPVCIGNQVSLMATPQNGGTSPVYQWQVNGINQGTNSSGFSYNPAAGDSVSCILTSNALCAYPLVATSNTVSIIVSNINQWTGFTDSNWDNPTNWECSTLPDSGINVIIPSGVIHFPVVSSSNTSICKDLIIDSLASLTILPGSDLSLYRSFTNNGQLSCNGRFIFRGDQPAQINAGTGSTVDFSQLSILKNAVIQPVIDVNTAVTVTSALAGAFVLDSGNLQLNTGGSLAFATAPAIGTSGIMTINGGSLIPGNFGMTNYGTFHVISGNAAIGMASGDAYQAEAGSLTRIDNGNVEFASRMQVDGAGSQFTMNGGTLKLCTIANNDPVFGSLEISGNSGLNISDGVIEFQQSCTAAADLNIVAGSGAKTITGGTIRFGNASTPQGTMFRISNDALPVHHLDMNNGSGLNLITSVSMNGTLTLTQGVIYAYLPAIFVFNAGASWTGGSDSSFIAGSADKNGNQAFVFPVGEVQGGVKVFAPIGISSPSDPSDVFRATYILAPSIHNSDLLYMSGNLINTSSVEYWELERIAGTSQVYVSLYWKDSVRSGINNPLGILVAHWNSSINKWEDMGGVHTPDPVGGHVTASVLSSSFSPFAFGGNNLFSDPLPVEILNFSSECHNGSKELSWTTASETNSDYYEIQRSQDAQNWESIGSVSGAGNSNTLTQYSFTDNQYSGLIYYRLKQVDFDGSANFYGPIAVNCIDDAKHNVEIFPNPFKTSFICSWSDMQGGIEIRIYNETGCLVREKFIDDAEKIQFADFDLSSSGSVMYIVEIRNQGVSSYHKLIKN